MIESGFEHKFDDFKYLEVGFFFFFIFLELIMYLRSSSQIFVEITNVMIFFNFFCARRMTANSSQRTGCRGHRSLEGGKGSRASTWRDWGGKGYWELPLMPKTLLKTLLPASSCPRCRA